MTDAAVVNATVAGAVAELDRLRIEPRSSTRQLQDLSPDPYLPSAHTGLMVQAIHQRANSFGRSSGLDIGVGSGVLLAALGTLGVRRLTGSDVDPNAVRRAAAMLDAAGFARRFRLFTGSLWDGLEGERFDVITANLPAFPATEACAPPPAPDWSCGGPDGRRLIDPFIAGLPRHLARGGVAFLAHNVFLGRARTDAMLRDRKLACTTVLRTSIPIDPRKSAFLNPLIRQDGPGGGPCAGLQHIGGYEFMEVEVLEIRRQRQMRGALRPPRLFVPPQARQRGRTP
jgi:release factor glutamine methyltransferase